MTDQIIKILKYILESNIINFILMIWLFAWLLKKFDLKSLFTKSIKSVDEYIQKSEKDKAHSEELADKAKDTLKQLPAQINEIKEVSEQKAKILLDKLEENTKKNVEKINKNIIKNKSIEEDKVSNNITEYAFSRSIEQATSGIIEMLKNNPDLHQKFIDESLEELEKSTCQ